MPGVWPVCRDGSSYQIISASLQTWDSWEEQRENGDKFCGWQSGVDAEWILRIQKLTCVNVCVCTIEDIIERDIEEEIERNLTNS